MKGPRLNSDPDTVAAAFAAAPLERAAAARSNRPVSAALAGRERGDTPVLLGARPSPGRARRGPELPPSWGQRQPESAARGAALTMKKMCPSPSASRTVLTQEVDREITKMMSVTTSNTGKNTNRANRPAASRLDAFASASRSPSRRSRSGAGEEGAIAAPGRERKSRGAARSDCRSRRRGVRPWRACARSCWQEAMAPVNDAATEALRCSRSRAAQATRTRRPTRGAARRHRREASRLGQARSGPAVHPPPQADRPLASLAQRRRGPSRSQASALSRPRACSHVCRRCRPRGPRPGDRHRLAPDHDVQHLGDASRLRRP